MAVTDLRVEYDCPVCKGDSQKSMVCLTCNKMGTITQSIKFNDWLFLPKGYVRIVGQANSEEE